MVSSALPWWPLTVFGIFEPVALIGGIYVAFSNPHKYYVDQTPGTSVEDLAFTPQALALTLMLGNIFVVLFFMALICCWTPHGEISRRYLAGLAMGDLGHMYASYLGMGPTVFWNLGAWNDMAYGNVAVGIFLFVNRLATLAGLFGRVGTVDVVKKRK